MVGQRLVLPAMLFGVGMFCLSSSVPADRVGLVKDGNPVATIVVSGNSVPAGFAARELQIHRADRPTGLADRGLRKIINCLAGSYDL